MSLRILSVYYKVDILQLSERLLTIAAETAYQATLTACADYLDQPDADVLVQADEGSLRTRIKAFAPAAMLYVAIANYDGFWNGIDRLQQHARAAGSFVKNAMDHEERIPKLRRRSRVTAGDFDRIRDALRAVERGTITAREALRRIRSIVGEDAFDLPPHIQQELWRSVEYAEASARTRGHTPRLEQVSFEPISQDQDGEEQHAPDRQPPHPEPRVILEISRIKGDERRRRILEW